MCNVMCVLGVIVNTQMTSICMWLLMLYVLLIEVMKASDGAFFHQKKKKKKYTIE